jgi:hypothetical protein
LPHRRDSGWSQSTNCETLPGKTTKIRCCWREPIPGSILGQKYCQTCTATTKPGIFNCTEKEKQSLTAPPTAGGNILQEEGVLAPLTEDESVLQQDGVLQQPPVQGIPPPITQDQGLFPEADLDQAPEDHGAAELPATTEEEPAPVCQEGLEFNEDLGFCVPTECPEGQELNEETGICVLEEPQQPVQEESQSDNEEQTSDQEDSPEEDNTNN